VDSDEIIEKVQATVSFLKIEVGNHNEHLERLIKKADEFLDATATRK